MAESTPATQEAVRRQLGGATASLADGSIPRQLTRLTIPMLFGISSMMLASLVDTYYVGQLGTVELAAMTLTFPLVMGFMTLTMGFGVGANSIISRTVGGGDWRKGQRIATHTLILVVIFVSVLVVIGFLSAEWIFRQLNASAELIPIAVKYTYITMLGVPVLALPMVGGTMLRSFNEVRAPAIMMVSGAVIQVVIAPLLIWGVGPFDGLGVYGSAWAFVLSRLAVAIYAAVIFSRRGLIQHPGTFQSFVESVREVMRLALPSMATQLLMPVSMYLILMLIAQYENHVVAAFGVASRIESMTMILIMALSSSLGPFIGQNFGAGRFDRIRAALRMCYGFCFAYGLFVTVFLVLFGDVIAGYFRADPGVIQVAREYFYIVPVTMGIMSVAMVAGSSFVAYGKPIPSAVLSVFRMFALLLPLCYLLESFWGYVGVFVAISATNGIVGLMAILWLQVMTNKLSSRAVTTAPHAPDLVDASLEAGSERQA